MARKQSKKGVQTGRNLPASFPNKYKTYTPGRRAGSQSLPEQALEAEVEPKSRRRTIIKRSLLVVLILIIGAIFAVIAWDVRNISSAEKKLFGTGNVMSLIIRMAW